MNKQEKLDKELNRDLIKVQDKICNALEKLEQEYGTRFQIVKELVNYN